MEIAVLTTEDGHFHRHHGFDEEAIHNSIRENIRAGRFVRGASTISMQLARNAYLGRERTLSRKLQEAILTLYLEQELTKREIMELYLNVIEFGPLLYGVGPAARHYFHASPSQLSLGQALYLASILPSPTKQHFGSGGAVSAQWSNHLRRLMKIVHKTKRINDEELAEALRETVVFGRASPMLAPPGTMDDDATGAGGQGPTPLDLSPGDDTLVPGGPSPPTPPEGAGPAP
jgi:membrane peptidoglycan carboxypeptidase